jgi:hypothetical protein
MDLTTNLSTDGRLTWDAPKGVWTVLRLGHTPMDRENVPVPPEGRGLECDKLNKGALDAHFAGMFFTLLREVGDEAGRTLSFTHIDSWEIGFQNWTPRFREEFQRRRGYDPLPYLPAFSGRVVESAETSERFLWDVRGTIADLVADNYAGRLAELAHAHGLKLSIEAYSSAGGGPFDSLDYASRADVPMGEFWNEADEPGRFHTCRTMASAAHTFGKKVVAAEAFSAWPAESNWQEHPSALKRLADGAFCEGVNQFFLQSHALQPWLNRKPGMTFGQWGLHYDRNATWWEFSKPWHEYLARCQFLLRQGDFVADACYLTPEDGFAEPPTRAQLLPPCPDGYDYDLISPAALLTRLSVKNGKLALPAQPDEEARGRSGLSYQLLVLPPTDRVTPLLLRRIKELISAGATVLAGPRPLKSPSLADFPRCDVEVNQMAEELWGNCDGRQINEHRLGQGRLVCGRSVEEVFAGMPVPPDFQTLTRVSGALLRRIHRRTDGEDFYFVTNPNARPVTAECAFRVTGRRPELWHPDSGKTEKLAMWRETNGVIIVPLKFDPVGSLFVVFRESSAGTDAVVTAKRNGKADLNLRVSLDTAGRPHLVASEPGVYELTTASGKRLRATVTNIVPTTDITGPWDLYFPTNWGAPAHVTLDALISWTEHRDPGVKFFSGTAIYRKTITLPKTMMATNRRWLLDLGQVQVIAEVKLEGRSLGVMWKPPFRVDITDRLKPGDNSLEIQVANLWPNRLIGDEQLPDDCRWRAANGDYGQPLGEWPQWLLEGRPSPTGRFTFTTWRHWTRNSPLVPSGLLGPVRLEAVELIRPE